jgi:hypothetical protein
MGGARTPYGDLRLVGRLCLRGRLCDLFGARRRDPGQRDRTIAAALVRLATGRAPAFMLGAGGETALTRVRRMLSPAAPLRRRERIAGFAAVTFLLVGPAAVAAIPGLSSFLAHHCHNISIF